MKKLLLSALALFALGMSAQTEVSPYRPGLTTDGITYFLPNTSLHITLNAKRITHVPGEFCKYAERYLRLKNVTMQSYDTWEITGMSVTPVGVANKDQAYSIKLKSKTSAPLVGLAPDGRLLTINAEAPELPKLSETKYGEPKSEKVDGSDFKTEEILLAGSTAKMAELTADEIFDIRDNRSLLAKGQADFMPKDGEQLKLMLASLDKQEKGLLQLFKGFNIEEDHVFVFDYTPQGEVSKDLIFRFSKHLGLVAADDLAGAPVTISVKDMHSLPAAVATDGKKKKEMQDLRYITPGSAQVKLYWGHKEFSSSVVEMAQFGRVEHLGGELFDKKFSTKVYLSPTTGGLVKIDLEQPEK